MDEKKEQHLWDELKLIQSIIDKFDNFTFTIKKWFLSVFVAVTGYVLLNKKYEILVLNVFAILAFYFYEVSYRVAQGAFLDRSREIQEALRKGDTIESPYLDKHLFHTPKTGCLLRFYEAILSDDDRAYKDRANKSAYTTVTLFRESLKMAFQPRVALVYEFALIINSILSFNWQQPLSCWWRQSLSFWLSLFFIIVPLLVAKGVVMWREKKARPRE